MNHFIAYHSVMRMGREYHADGHLKFMSKKLSILKQAIGNTVWVVQRTVGHGIASYKGKPVYTLCGAYLANEVEAISSDTYVIRAATGFDFAPPVILNTLTWFPTLFKSQNNFSYGFNQINDTSVTTGLLALRSECENVESTLLDIDLVAAKEGATRLVSHLRRERNRAIVKEKKAQVLKAEGCLRCECCEFDFSAAYGELGAGFCEVHHKKALSAHNETITTLDDLAVLCSNCHRMIHLTEPMFSVEAFSRLVFRYKS
jgi:5-methylcytosine-specific restriction endonuclease McrA